MAGGTWYDLTSIWHDDATTLCGWLRYTWRATRHCRGSEIRQCRTVWVDERMSSECRTVWWINARSRRTVNPGDGEGESPISEQVVLSICYQDEYPSSFTKKIYQGKANRWLKISRRLTVAYHRFTRNVLWGWKMYKIYFSDNRTS